MKGDAKFDKDKIHRYTLWRSWNDNLPKILFIGLNPSRADSEFNDPTIKKVCGFAKSWGYGGIFFGNLYSFRTPYVKGPIPLKELLEGWKPLLDNLNRATDHLTDFYLQSMIQTADKIICAWGSWRFTEARVNEVMKMIERPYCFGTNQDGSPKHPLYLKSSTLLSPFNPATGHSGE
ncbi:MAG: DUF1643 domain-containing protein [Chitinophagaceae bacterium]